MKKLSMEALGRLSTDAYFHLEKTPLVLVLDNVRSGLNVGSVFRTADAFAVEKIVLCGITARPPHREILKTALGSTETVAWTESDDTATTVEQLKQGGYRVFAVEQTTDKIWLQDFLPVPEEKYALVFGNEVDGVADAVLRACHGVIEIPQFGTKHSLNIAVAAGIVIWEFARKLRSNQ
ncbi:MAG: RNA methyltransferase [Lewinellaceae bacterium]|nr:RNA methyltransferase [Lewinellaceae bacterium]